MAQPTCGVARAPTRYDTGFLTVQLLRAAEELHGVDLDTLLDRTDLEPNFLEQPLRPIPFSTASQLVERVVATTGDPLLGLRAGLNASLPRALGVTGVLLSHAPTHRAWMEDAAELQNRMSNVGELSLEPEGDCVSFTLRRRVEASVYTDQTLEFHAGLAVSLARKAPDPRTKPVAVELLADRVRRMGRKVYEDMVDCVVLPTKEHTGTRYRAAALSIPLGADEDVYEVLAPVVEQEIAKLPRFELTRDVVSAALQRSLLSEGRPLDLAGAAVLLGVSRRTLQQRLQREGTSLQCLLDDVRRRLAQRWIEQGQPRERISRQLGYSESAAFRRAWRRWSAR